MSGLSRALENRALFEGQGVLALLRTDHAPFTLGLLAEHPNRALPAAFLHNAVWTHHDSEHGEEEVAAYIAALREKLKLDQPGSPCRIVDEDTERGSGYRFTCSAG